MLTETFSATCLNFHCAFSLVKFLSFPLTLRSFLLKQVHIHFLTELLRNSEENFLTTSDIIRR
jgi:hypothetical protein